jgi:hypothetical protein
LRTVHTLTDEQLDALARGWAHAVLQTDEEARRDGPDDEAFADLGEGIREQLVDVGAMLVQGRTDKARPAMAGRLNSTRVSCHPDRRCRSRAAHEHAGDAGRAG